MKYNNYAIPYILTIQSVPAEVVKIASETEREYIGLNNGLLDQACIALGKKDVFASFCARK